MRVLIVDDEPLSRTALADLVSRRPDVHAYDLAEDASQAIEYLKRSAYEILLLDIHMPEVTGLELVDHLRRESTAIPAIIFVTAYHEHAVAAFEKKAIDYVLKPFASERVHEALDTAIQRSAEERAARQLQMLTNLNLILKQPARIALKVEGRILFVDPEELITAEANGNYVLLHQKSGSYLLRDSIAVLAGKLAPYGFIRIHRSVLVNAAFVETIQPSPTGEYVLRLKKAPGTT